jgi:hypothetical protein
MHIFFFHTERANSVFGVFEEFNEFFIISDCAIQARSCARFVSMFGRQKTAGQECGRGDSIGVVFDWRRK